MRHFARGATWASAASAEGTAGGGDLDSIRRGKFGRSTRSRALNLPACSDCHDVRL